MRWAIWTAGLGLFAAAATAQERSDAEALNEKEKQFVAQLTGATLEGRFTITDQPVDPGPKPDKYTITKVEKRDGNQWLFIARVEYNEGSYPVAIKVPVEWAGDTPVICVTDLEIPIVAKGKFHARVLIDKGRYAGTWGHDDVGGHMWGQILPKGAAADKEANPANGKSE